MIASSADGLSFQYADLAPSPTPMLDMLRAETARASQSVAPEDPWQERDELPRLVKRTTNLKEQQHGHR